MEAKDNLGMCTKVLSLGAALFTLGYLPQAGAARIEVIKDQIEIDTRAQLFYWVDGARTDLIAEDTDRYRGSIHALQEAGVDEFELGSWTEYHYTNPMTYNGIEYVVPGMSPGPHLGADRNSRATVEYYFDRINPSIELIYEISGWSYNQDPYLDAVSGYYDWWSEGSIKLDWTFQVIGEDASLDVWSRIFDFFPDVYSEFSLYDLTLGSHVSGGISGGGSWYDRRLRGSYDLQNGHTYALSSYSHVGSGGQDPDPDAIVNLYFNNANIAYVAEPSSLSLMLLGMVGMVWSAVRQQRPGIGHSPS
jgi:hypothetical protein